MIRLMRYPLAATLAIWAVWASPAIRADDKPHRYADELRQQADSLIASAIKRPYGWGWTEAEPEESAAAKVKVKPAYVPVAMGPGETPAAGLILLWAAKLQNEPKYAEAARQVARGVAASDFIGVPPPSICPASCISARLGGYASSLARFR